MEIETQRDRESRVCRIKKLYRIDKSKALEFVEHVEPKGGVHRMYNSM